MQFEITKLCADSLRSFSQNKFGIQIKSSHAHELVAAYMGYSSRAALLADSKCPIINLRQANILVLTPAAPIKERRAELKGLPENLPDDIAEGIYLTLCDKKWILHKIWPTLEELGKALADQHLKLKPPYFRDQRVQREGFKLEFHSGEVAIIVFREYVSPSLTLSTMKNVTRGVIDVFYLKRVACHIGYVLSNHHATDAETLDEAINQMAKISQQLSNEQSLGNETKMSTEFNLGFSDWLLKHKKRNSPLGDLAQEMAQDQTWPILTTLDGYRDYLYSKGAGWQAIQALENAWKSYRTFLKRKNPSKSSKQNIKKPIIKKFDSRKVTFIKSIIPLHYNKRTIEKIQSRG